MSGVVSEPWRTAARVALVWAGGSYPGDECLVGQMSYLPSWDRDRP